MQAQRSARLSTLPVAPLVARYRITVPVPVIADDPALEEGAPPPAWLLMRGAHMLIIEALTRMHPDDPEARKINQVKRRVADRTAALIRIHELAEIMRRIKDEMEDDDESHAVD